MVDTNLEDRDFPERLLPKQFGLFVSCCHRQVNDLHGILRHCVYVDTAPHSTAHPSASTSQLGTVVLYKATESQLRMIAIKTIVKNKLKLLSFPLGWKIGGGQGEDRHPISSREDSKNTSYSRLYQG